MLQPGLFRNNVQLTTVLNTNWLLSSKSTKSQQ